MQLLISRASQPAIGLPQPGESKSQYVPHGIQMPNGDLWVYVKGDESGSIHAHRSTDGGLTFTWQGIALAPNPGSWDSTVVIDPVVWREAGQIHLLYKGVNHVNGYYEWGIGYATAEESDPLTFTRVGQVMSSAAMLQQVQSAWSSLNVTEIRDVYLSDVVRDPWGLLVAWGGFYGQHGTPYRIVRFRGSGPMDLTLRSEGRIDPEPPYDFVQAPCVYRDGDRYVCLFTEGSDGTNEDYRYITAATCATDGNWAWTRAGVTVLDVGPSGAWDDRKAFAAHLLKGGAKFDAPVLVDGAWQLYYAGSSMSDPNRARSGVARLQPVSLVTI